MRGSTVVILSCQLVSELASVHIVIIILAMQAQKDTPPYSPVTGRK